MLPCLSFCGSISHSHWTYSGCTPSFAGQVIDQLVLEADELVVGPFVDIRPAAAGIAAPAERAALADLVERVGRAADVAAADRIETSIS